MHIPKRYDIIKHAVQKGCDNMASAKKSPYERFTCIDVFSQIQFSSRLLENVTCNAHMHSCIEILLTVEGVMHLWLGDREYRVPAGSAIYFEPFERHNFVGDSPNRSYILEFQPEYAMPFWQYIEKFNTNDRMIRLSQETFSYLCAKLPEHMIYFGEQRPDASFLQAVLGPLCYEFITQCTPVPQEKRPDAVYIAALRLISHLIWQDPFQDLSQTAIAQKLNIHRCTLSKQFAEFTDVTYTDYLQYVRVCAAGYHLRRGLSITNAAFNAGFHSVRTFNRVFKQITGHSPGEYAAKAGTTDAAESLFAYDIYVGP